MGQDLVRMLAPFCIGVIAGYYTIIVDRTAWFENAELRDIIKQQRVVIEECLPQLRQ